MILMFSNCGHSPAWPLIPVALAELEQAGFGFQPNQPPVWHDPCLILKDDDGRVKGFLVYRVDEQNCAWFILLAYVAPEARRTGIHTALFHALVERAEKRGDILSIRSGVHIDNHVSQSALKAQGRMAEAVMYTFPIRDWLEGKSHLDGIENNGMPESESASQ